MTNFCQELHRIVQHKLLQPLYQPIVSMQTQQIIGFEALIRGPSDSPLHSPLKLFESAYQCHALESLEMLCREISIREFTRQQGSSLLFLNVNPLLLLQADHPSGLTLALLETYGLDPSNVVIELSEQYQVDDSDLLLKAVQHYRELGFQIAIDDLGSGFSGLKLWSELKPDIIKIDRYFISQLEQDATKKAFVRTIIELAKTTGARVVAEGIETQAEYLVCRELGADFAQGYLLARPHSLLLQQSALLTAAVDITDHWTAMELMTTAPIVRADQKVREVWRLFAEHPTIGCFAVVQDTRCVGVVTRAALQQIYAGAFGRALYDNKHVSQLMQRQFLQLAADCPIDEIPARWPSAASGQEQGFCVVTADDHYAGILALQQVLEHQTAAKLMHARYANPLTLLPGNVPLHREIDRMLANVCSFHIAYLDLDHFKAFNDFYGYSRGDNVIQLLASLLQVESRWPNRFLAHIGGDDFVMLFCDDTWQASLKNVQQQFNQRVSALYDEPQRRDGGIHTLSRTGEPCFFPLMTLSIGVATPDVQRCSCHHDVASLAASAKQQAKQLAGRDIFVCRRRSPLSLVS